MSISVTVLLNKILNYAGNVNRKVEDATAKVALDIEADWKQNIKSEDLIDTGTYLDSVQARREGPGAWIIESGVEYAIYLEYGTSRGIRPYGVATRAAEDNRAAYERAIAEALGEV